MSQEYPQISDEYSEFDEASSLISARHYDQAWDLIQERVIRLLDEDDAVKSSAGLNLLYKICDKTDYTIDRALEFSLNLLDNTNAWVREVALTIIRKTVLFRPDTLDPALEKLESMLYDSDKNVRVEAIRVIGKIIKWDRLTRYPHLLVTFSRAFEDDSWMIKATAIEMANEFFGEDLNPDHDLIRNISRMCIELFDDQDEEIRMLGAELLKNITRYLSPQELINIIMPLLNDDNWIKKEKAIWIIGEICGDYCEDFEVFIKKLVFLLADENLMIQTKAIDALVKIGMKNALKLFKMLVSVIDTEDEDILQGIMEAIVFIALHNPKQIVPQIIETLGKNFTFNQKIGREILLKIYMEIPEIVEEEIYKLFQNIDPDDWKSRKDIARIVGDLNYILKIKSIARWTTINLQNWLENEEDLDVKEEIQNSLDKIKNVFSDMDEEIKALQDSKAAFIKKMHELIRAPRQLRNKIEALIREKQFNEAEITMEEESIKIIERMDELEKELNESEFRRCSLDIFQEFKDIKDELLEQISDLKAVMVNRLYDEREAYLEELKEVKKAIHDRIDIVESEYNHLQELEKELENQMDGENTEKIAEFLKIISSIRKKMFKLEYDIGQIWIKNLDFKDFLQSMTIYWIDMKLDIQKYLADIFYKFQNFRNLGDSDDESDLKRKINFEFLNQQFQNIVIQAIKNINELLRKFNELVEPVEAELKKHKCRNAKSKFEIIKSNLYGSIENYNREINEIYSQIDNLKLNFESANEIRQLMQKWADTKDKLLKRINDYEERIKNVIFLEEIREFLNYMNPIPLNYLAEFMDLSQDELKSRLFSVIKSGKINAKIKENELISPERPAEQSFIKVFKRVEVAGSKLSFSVRIYNASRYFIKNIDIVFVYPDVLKLMPQISDATMTLIREFEPEASRIMHWNFKINKIDPTKYNVQKIMLNISYTNPFNQRVEITKELEMII